MQADAAGAVETASGTVRAARAHRRERWLLRYDRVFRRKLAELGRVRAGGEGS